MFCLTLDFYLYIYFCEYESAEYKTTTDTASLQDANDAVYLCFIHNKNNTFFLSFKDVNSFHQL